MWVDLWGIGWVCCWGLVCGGWGSKMDVARPVLALVQTFHIPESSTNTTIPRVQQPTRVQHKQTFPHLSFIGRFTEGIEIETVQRLG